jgi:hypothetical protein
MFSRFLSAAAIGDVMLAQKIALELYEMDALNIANKMPAEFHFR